MTPRYIVAEISKNWHVGQSATDAAEFLSWMFEHIINVNRDRGYRLMSWQLHRMLVTPWELNETIIAVFERVD